MDSTKTTEGMTACGPGETDEIMSDIVRTRERMDQTISELGDRLDPRHAVHDLVDEVKTWPASVGRSVAGGFSRAGREVVEYVQEHPVSLLLLGAGITLFIMENKRRNTGSDYTGADYPSSQPPALPGNPGSIPAPTTPATPPGAYAAGSTGGSSYAGSGVGPDLHTDEASSTSAIQRVGAGAGAVGRRLTDAAHRVKESAAHAGERLKGGATRAVTNVRSKVSDGYHYSQDRFRYGRENYPLAMGAGFLALGLLMGYALPITERENRLMGQAASRVKDRTVGATRDVARRVADRVSEQANRAAEAIGAGQGGSEHREPRQDQHRGGATGQQQHSSPAATPNPIASSPPGRSPSGGPIT